MLRTCSYKFESCTHFTRKWGGDAQSFWSLDLFPVFELFIQASQNYAAICYNIEICLWKDLHRIDPDMCAILGRLRGISDPYVRQTLIERDTAVDRSMRLMHYLPDVNGQVSYNCKKVDLNLWGLRIQYLSYLTDYLSQQQVQTFTAAQDTISKASLDFKQLYHYKLKASQNLNNINNSKLMIEVRWILLNKPFYP